MSTGRHAVPPTLRRGFDQRYRGHAAFDRKEPDNRDHTVFLLAGCSQRSRHNGCSASGIDKPRRVQVAQLVVPLGNLHAPPAIDADRLQDSVDVDKGHAGHGGTLSQIALELVSVYSYAVAVRFGHVTAIEWGYRPLPADAGAGRSPRECLFESESPETGANLRHERFKLGFGGAAQTHHCGTRPPAVELRCGSDACRPCADDEDVE